MSKLNCLMHNLSLTNLVSYTNTSWPVLVATTTSRKPAAQAMAVACLSSTVMSWICPPCLYLNCPLLSAMRLNVCLRYSWLYFSSTIHPNQTQLSFQRCTTSSFHYVLHLPIHFYWETSTSTWIPPPAVLLLNFLNFWTVLISLNMLMYPLTPGGTLSIWPSQTLPLSAIYWCMTWACLTTKSSSWSYHICPPTLRKNTNSTLGTWKTSTKIIWQWNSSVFFLLSLQQPVILWISITKPCFGVA